jgi:hypothetical protein
MDRAEIIAGLRAEVAEYRDDRSLSYRFSKSVLLKLSDRARLLSAAADMLEKDHPRERDTDGGE